MPYRWSALGKVAEMETKVTTEPSWSPVPEGIPDPTKER
jgi:hypothetical protein